MKIHKLLIFILIISLPTSTFARRKKRKQKQIPQKETIAPKETPQKEKQLHIRVLLSKLLPQKSFKKWNCNLKSE